MKIKTFILNENLNNLDKLSCHNYEPDILDLLNKLKEKGILLKDLAEKKGIISGPMGYHLHTYDYVDKNLKNCVKLLQISNINEFGEIISIKRDKYISKEKSEIDLKNSQVKKNDLIIAKTGEIGRIAIFKENYKANLNQALGIIRLEEEYKNIKVNSEFIHLYLNSFYAETQFNFFGGNRAGQSGLSLQEIKDIYIILPNKKEQLKIIEEVNKLRLEANKHYENYLKYSNEIGNLIDEKLTHKTKIDKKEIFKINKVKDRLDCYFNFLRKEKYKKYFKNNNYFDIFNNEDFNIVKQISKSFKSENEFKVFKYIDLNKTEKNIGLIKDFEENNLIKLPNRAGQFCIENDLLLPKPIGSNKGILIVPKEFDKQFFTTGFLQFRFEKEKEELLFFYIFKSKFIQEQLFLIQSGCVQPDINENNFINYLVIPYPKDEEIRNQIIKECEELRNKAIFEKEQYEFKKKKIWIKFKEMLEKNI